MVQPLQLQSQYHPAGDQPQAIAKLVSAINAGMSKQTVLGVTGSGKTFTIANVLQQCQRPAVVLAPNKTLAAQLYGEFKSFFPNNAVEYFVSYYDYYQPEAYVPSTDTFIEKDAAINEQIEQMRLSATKALLERRDAIIIASVSAIYGLGDPQAYLKMVLHLFVDQKLDQRAMLRRLAELQYTRNDIEFYRGCYRVRGDIVDIFPAEAQTEAVRLHLFDDQIEKIQHFDPLTGEIFRDLPRVTIYPKTHYVTPRDRVVKAIEDIKEELRERLAELNDNHKLVEAQRLQQRTQYDLEMLAELGYCNGIENYSRHLSGRPAGEPPPTLIDYLPGDALVVIDESHVTVPQLGAMYRGDRSRKETLVTYGFRLPSALDNRPLRFEEFERIAQQIIYVSATPGPYELEHSQQVVELVVRPTGLLDPQVEIRPASNQVNDLLSEITKVTTRKERVLVTTLTKRMAEDLCHYFSDHGVKVRYMHSDIDTVERVQILRELRLGSFDVLIGINLLREGLDLPEVSLVAILDADKEGFLRSERSLVQTIGRAARHLHGRAILYADQITESMQRAIQETERRRRKQEEHNREHGVTPKGIHSAIHHVIESQQYSATQASKGSLSPEVKKIHKQVKSYSLLDLADPQKFAKILKQLEQNMHEHAKNLEFEEAAACRDQMQQLKQTWMSLS